MLKRWSNLSCNQSFYWSSIWLVLHFSALNCIANSHVYFIVEIGLNKYLWNRRGPTQGAGRHAVLMMVVVVRRSLLPPAAVIKDGDVNCSRLHQQVSQEPPCRWTPHSPLSRYTPLLSSWRSHTEKQMSFRGSAVGLMRATNMVLW